MSRRSAPSLLHDLVHHAERIREVFAAAGSRRAFESSSTSKEAVLWNFVVLGEVCVRLGEPFQQEVIAQRNVIAHGYDIVDWNLLIGVIEQDLTTLIREARKIIDTYGPPPIA